MSLTRIVTSSGGSSLRVRDGQTHASRKRAWTAFSGPAGVVSVLATDRPMASDRRARATFSRLAHTEPRFGSQDELA